VSRKPAIVMLVDDEPMVRRAVARTLTQAGHLVISCSGLEAVEAELAKGNVPDLLITDVVLGNSTGKLVAATVKEWSPKTKVVFMSGYDNISVGEPILQKPFKREELTTVIEQALATGNAVADEAPFSLTKKKTQS
jgi:DNA-binding NtrC family response regulator